jgi:hypothetical protein
MDPVKMTIHEHTADGLSRAGMTFEIPLPPIGIRDVTGYWLQVRNALEMVHNVFLSPPMMTYRYPPLDGEDAQLPF